MADLNGTLLQGLAGILRQASAATGTPGPSTGSPGQPQSAAAAATALAELINGLAGALGAAAAQTTPAPAPGAPPPAQPTVIPPRGSVAAAMVPEDDGSGGYLPSVEEFVERNSLESWVADALYLLTSEQKAHIMRTPLNLEHASNLNGVITSRIKEVAPVEQRLEMFIALNGLAEGVVDRLSTLTPDQHEKVMESTLKLTKANNPSGVAMRRITDVLRNERLGIVQGPHMSSPSYRDQPGSTPKASPPTQPQQANAATTLLNSLIENLGGSGAVGGAMASEGRDRSRSRPPAGAVTSLGAGSGHVPRDIQTFLNDYSLDWWVGEVLARLSLWQRQNVMTELGSMQGVRNPSGVVMTRVKQVANTQELLTIFIDLNQLDQHVSDELWALTEEQQLAVMAPGVYIQNARSPSVAAKSRIKQVLAGNDAMGGARRAPVEHHSTGGGNDPWGP